MPVIISSYASTNIQGRGNENKERIKEALEKYEKLNEISDEIPSDDIIQDVDITKKNEGYNDRVKSNVVELSVDAVDPDDILILGEEKEVSESSKVITTTEVVEPNVTSTEQTPTTTSATTTQFEKEESNLEIRTDIPISNGWFHFIFCLSKLIFLQRLLSTKKVLPTYQKFRQNWMKKFMEPHQRNLNSL